MDHDLTIAFARLSSQIADVGRDARAAVDLAKENERTTRETLGRVVQLDGRIVQLEKEVFGSNPPPSPVAAAPRPRIVARVSETEIDVDDVRGRVLAIDGRCERIEKELEKQSKSMGLTEKTVWKDYVKWVWSPAGRRSLLRLATLAGALYAAFQSAKVTSHPVESSSSVVTVPSGGKP